MSPTYTDSELIEGYRASYDESCDHDGAVHNPEGEAPLHFWAFEEMTDLVGSNPEHAWPLIIRMLRDTEDASYQAYVEAGPLEDLLCWHGPQFIDRIEALAKSEKWFQNCLSGVWGQNRMNPEIYARIQAIVKCNT